MAKNKLKIIMGKNIEKERNARGLTISELAPMLKISASHLGRIENGEKGTSPLMCYNLAEVFNITVDGLFVCDNNDSDRSRFIREDSDREG